MCLSHTCLQHLLHSHKCIMYSTWES
uniref:Uncharacterized protein n=1 Tax=Anguilla anguilla TaxID=7936 RepID=A0A0E9XEB4_ANGAN